MANPKAPESENQGSEAALPAEPAPQRDALVITNASSIVCRPPAGVAISTLGPVVIGHWRGTLDGKAVEVAHGTPVRGLPPAILKKIQATPGQRVGPFDPRKKGGGAQAPVVG